MELSNMDDFYNIISAEHEYKEDVKIIYDLFSSYFIYAISKDANRDKVLEGISEKNAKEMIKWFEEFPIPFYEQQEEFEKCAKLKNIIDIIKKAKNIDIY